MNTYATLYEITADGEYEVSFEWDDSLITDIDEELNKRMTLMQNGLSSKLETRMWYFGETERQAQEALIKIDQENMQAMETDLAMQSNFIDNSGGNNQVKKKDDSKKNQDKKPKDDKSKGNK